MRRIGYLTVLVLIGLMLTSCAKKEAVVVKEGTPLKPKNGKQFVIGWVPMNDPQNEYWKAYDDGVKEAVTKAGGKLLYSSPQGDPVKQNDCIDQFIAQDVDFILVYPIDSSAVGGGIRKANESGIPVAVFWNAVHAGTSAKVLFSVAQDDWEAGRRAANAMVEALTEKLGQPKGKVLEVQGLMTTTGAQLRGGGFHEVIDKHRDIKVTAKPGDWDTGRGTTVIQEWMTANPDTDGIYFHSDGAYTPAAQAALSAIGRWVPKGKKGHVILTGEDGTNFAVHSIKYGYMEYTSGFSHADIGALLGSLAMEYLKTGSPPKVGQKISRPETMWKEADVVEKKGISGPLVFIPLQEITRENADHPDLFANKCQGPPNGLSPCRWK